jgi:uroporphyrin-3 C-methyltransferase
MNEPTQISPASEPVKSNMEPAKPAEPHINRFGSILARVTLTQLTLLVLVAVFVWQWLDAHSQLDQTQQEVARRLSEVEASNKANQMLGAQTQEMVRELGGKLSLVESKYAETQNQRAALEALYQEMSSSRDQTALADVEQLLLIAEQQLQLSANVKAALIALQQAESRLQRPALAGLKKHIGQDIEKLRALPNVDVAAINLRLDAVINAVDSLVLEQDAHIATQQPTPVADQGVGAWRRFWNEIRQEARQLLRIENTERQELPLLSPTQSFFLRENLKLRLLSAHMALLTRDEVSFRRDLKTSQEWIKRYFETKSGASVQALATLQQLAASNIAVDLPDLSGSLEAVRNYRISHERSAR